MEVCRDLSRHRGVTDTQIHRRSYLKSNPGPRRRAKGPSKRSGSMGSLAPIRCKASPESDPRAQKRSVLTPWNWPFLFLGVPMLAITLWPEWAWAVRFLGKNVENREWDTLPEEIRGKWIAIHGGQAIGGLRASHFHQGHRDAIRLVLDTYRVIDGRERERLKQPITCRSVLAEGQGIVAFGYVADLLKDTRQAGWYAGHPALGIGMSMVNPLIRPEPCRGARGLWTLPDEIAMQYCVCGHRLDQHDRYHGKRVCAGCSRYEMHQLRDPGYGPEWAPCELPGCSQI